MSYQKRRLTRQVRGRLKLITPTTQAIPLAEAKEYLRVDQSDEDTIINRQVRSAESLVKNYLNQSLKNETYTYTLDNWPCPERDVWWDGVRDGAINQLTGDADYIDLPWGPFVNVTNFETIDDSDTSYTFASSNYKVDSTSKHGRVSLAEGAVWPATVLRSNSGIVITFTAGFGTDDSDVPEAIRQGVLETLGALYERRGDAFTGLPAAALNLLETYRAVNI